MRNRRIFIPFALLMGLLAATPVYAGNVRALAKDAKSPQAKIDAIAWMAGRWTGEGLGGQVEEFFSPPVGGAMVGHFRSSKDNQPRFYELETVDEENGSLVYHVKHFNPDMIGWEEKDKMVVFPLVAIEGNRLYFDGLTIERTGPDEMRHYVEIGDKSGATREVSFVYHREKTQ